MRLITIRPFLYRFAALKEDKHRGSATPRSLIRQLVVSQTEQRQPSTDAGARPKPSKLGNKLTETHVPSQPRLDQYCSSYL